MFHACNGIGNKFMRMIENHVESCHCWDVGTVRISNCKYPRSDVAGCRAMTSATTLRCGGRVRAMFDHTDDGDPCFPHTGKTRTRRHRMVLDTDIDRIYGKIDDAIGDIERAERKVGTRRWVK